MTTFQDDFINSLKAGYYDESIQHDSNFTPHFLVNNTKEGVKFLSTIQKELLKCNEFWISVAFVTTSGVASIKNTLIELKERGIRGKLLVSSYLFFTQPEALRKLLHFDNIELKISTTENFHSKGYLFYNDGFYDLIIGSSNLTGPALCSNKEWNLKISATPKSSIISSAEKEFKAEFELATKVDHDFIYRYDLKYQQYQAMQSIQKATENLDTEWKEFIPNKMQKDALENLKLLRLEKKNKALIISATGTGKTFLSAFDAKEFKAKKLLFVVHRHNIAEAALQTFKKVFGTSRSFGHYSTKDPNTSADFIFTTVQTISKESHFKQFAPNHFDYVIIDESHRAGAETYQTVLDYFTPSFLLGMTATPERTDGYNIFELFNHTIAYEIRLHKALEEDMLSPFHYYGVTDISVDGVTLDENADFSLLASDERVKHIVEKAEFYGCDNGRVRGLAFCSRKDECRVLSDAFNRIGYRTLALTGDNTEEERNAAIDRLESDEPTDRLDYIFTVDIFNEGIDIPRVNQVLMLRPTQSAIIFVQQLGRGLRKAKDKEYLTVIDFIGNYSNNYLVPIALYGDTTYNKDHLRKCVANGSALIPGASTINFDKITKERIFESINTAKMSLSKDLKADYNLLKFKLGRAPMMVDFLEHGSRDPQLYVESNKSYYNFLLKQEVEYKDKLNTDEVEFLNFFSEEINNGVRVEESIILSLMLEKGRIQWSDIKLSIYKKFGYTPSNETIESCLNNLNLGFTTQKYEGTKKPLKDCYQVIKVESESIEFHHTFSKLLKNDFFNTCLWDNINYSIQVFSNNFKLDNYVDGFILYKKYARKDVFRILNWKQNPNPQNVGGYILSTDKSNCPIFVTYNKEEHISNSTKYEDRFLSNSVFQWMSKNKRTLNSPDVQAIKSKTKLRLPLFIKKSNDEGINFYFMGELTPIHSANSFIQDTMKNDKNEAVSVVKILYNLSHPVEETLYDYFEE